MLATSVQINAPNVFERGMQVKPPRNAVILLGVGRETRHLSSVVRLLGRGRQTGNLRKEAGVPVKHRQDGHPSKEAMLFEEVGRQDDLGGFARKRQRVRNPKEE
jgi:hypothetical protein